ncbi:hypothetical protein ROZALSC1DRAFT_27037 [Rozella allomycis CSF55]|uniref:Uncharacterized protein n=1 Tax=Rozella allomycis (strain CSF55) TaxID=988480 RepID=A0A075AZG7_ROZAC|nr:hypothetical protein O9G_004362 [Rozella allomycis CSF55]RKP21581.1 hypothetical protein ROZALSC1DRAFT_27037 [Rozella allomycis CSF55]|eukprot:EPZ35705.1 hypothetical protein O9G_004362 [Rozella allomycis CSF55]
MPSYNLRQKRNSSSSDASNDNPPAKKLSISKSNPYYKIFEDFPDIPADYLSYLRELGVKSVSDVKDVDHLLKQIETLVATKKKKLHKSGETVLYPVLRKTFFKAWLNFMHYIATTEKESVEKGLLSWKHWTDAKIKQRLSSKKRKASKSIAENEKRPKSPTKGKRSVPFSPSELKKKKDALKSIHPLHKIKSEDLLKQKRDLKRLPSPKKTKKVPRPVDLIGQKRKLHSVDPVVHYDPIIRSPVKSPRRN